MYLSDEFRDGGWDLDNKSWIYFKAFQDLLVEQSIIPDDSVNYITGNEYLFQSVNSQENRSMDFYIYKDERKGIYPAK
jgi:hypothetical protein